MKEKIKLLKKYGFIYDRKSDTWVLYKNKIVKGAISNRALKGDYIKGLKHWINDILNIPPKYKRKYKHGSQIKRFNVLINAIDNHNYIMLRNKPIHPSWISNMSIQTIRQYIREGILFKAVKIK